MILEVFVVFNKWYQNHVPHLTVLIESSDKEQRSCEPQRKYSHAREICVSN